MEIRNKFVLIIFAFLFLGFFVSATFAVPATDLQPADGQFTLIETQITSSESDQIDPVIYGDRMVWQDERNGNWDIYQYNLSTSTETQITVNEHNQTKPAIYGDRIVWQDERNGNSDIYMYDLSTHQETQITDEPSDQIGPVIYGDRIVWQDESDKRIIYLHELSTPRRLFNLFWNNQDLDLFSIVTSSDNSKFQKIIKKLTCKETSITSCESNKNEPAAIYGNKVVWADKCNISQEDSSNLNNRTNPDNPSIYSTRIYMYDVSSSTETPITMGFTSDESCMLPAIYEKRIVWQDERNGNSDIYMYDLSTSTETRITTNESKQEMPVIYGDRVVWQDNRNGNRDIYMCTLVPTIEKPLSPASNAYESSLNFISQLFGLS